MIGLLLSLVVALTGQHVSVNCDTIQAMPKGAAGWADIETGTIHVRRDYCVSAAHAFNGKPDSMSGPSLVVFIHETLHIEHPYWTEGEVECAAIRNVWSLITKLPLTSKQRHSVYNAALHDHNLMPPNYRSEC